MTQETRDALVARIAVASRDAMDALGAELTWHEHNAAAVDIADMLAAPSSPVLLVARGDVEEQVIWRVRIAGREDTFHHEDAARRRHAEVGGSLGMLTVRSWSLPDGSRVEVTGPWVEAAP